MRFFRSLRKVVTIFSLVVYFLAQGIPIADPTSIANAAGNFTISGTVYFNGSPVWDGFQVTITGSRGTTLKADTKGGKYVFTGFSAGTYTINHFHNCPSNTPKVITVSGNSIFDIQLNCPKQKVTVWGRVLVDSNVAWNGFSVRMKNKTTGKEYWADVSNGDGWYLQEGVEEGWYTFTHYEQCAGDNNLEAWIGPGAEVAPQINITCTKPKVTVWGRVLVDGNVAWNGFSVRLKNKDTGKEYWPSVFNGDGWYLQEGVEEGWYTFTHYEQCAGDNNLEVWIGPGAEVAPQINITCTKPKVTVWGRVIIDGMPAHNGFSVRLKNKETGHENWPDVFNGDGWYLQQGVVEGWYTFTHYANCPGDNNLEAWIGPGKETAPQINLQCSKPRVTLWGRVTIDGKPAHNGFKFRIKNTATGQQYWPEVSNGDGWYNKPLVEEGTYQFTHFSTCEGNNNFEARIGLGEETAPQITLTCSKPLPTHSLSGLVFVNGRPPHQGFGVKAVRNGVSYWTEITNNEGRYTFSSLEEGEYYVGHNHPCPTNEGNPIKFTVDGRAGPNLNIDCKPDPQPLPPESLPTFCEANTGFVTKRFNLGSFPETIVATGPGYYITQKPFGEVEAVLCPEHDAQLGLPGSDILFRVNSTMGEVSINKDGGIVSSMNVGASDVQFECQGWGSNSSSCEVSLGFDARVPNSDFGVKGDVGARYTLVIEGEEKLVSYTLGAKDIMLLVERVVIVSAGVAAILFLPSIINSTIGNWSGSFYLWYGGVIDEDPPGVPAAMVSASSTLPEHILQAVKNVYGEAFVESALLSTLTAEMKNGFVYVEAKGLTADGEVVIFVTEEDKLFPEEPPLAVQRIKINEVGEVYTMVHVDHSNKPILIFLIDLTHLEGGFEKFIEEEQSDFTYTGQATLLHPDETKTDSQSKLYLPTLRGE